MKVWKDILRTVLETGEKRNDRTGCGTLAIFGAVLEFDNENSFPAVTTKKLAFKPMIGEMSCFLRGKHYLKDFHEVDCKIWDKNGNADYWTKNPNNIEPGNYLGRIYGVNWIDWKSIHFGEVKTTNQLKNVVDGIKKEPHGRRHIVTSYNPGELDQVALPCCPTHFQFFVRGVSHIDMIVYMRSVDLFLGLPFDVASYAILQRLVAKETGLKSGKLKFMLADTHIYLNHIDQVKIVLEREELPPPNIELSEDASLFNFMPDQIRIINYNSHSTVKADMAV